MGGQPRPAATRTLVLRGGKGGVGATQIAANLAVELSLKGSRVLLVDGGIGNAGVVLGVDAAFDLSHVVSGEKTVEEIVCEGPGGIGLLPTYQDPEAAASLAPWQRERLSQGVTAAAAQYDFVLVDSGRSASPEAPGSAPEVSAMVVVTTPEPASVAGAYATMKELVRTDPRVRIQVLVNMAADRAEAARSFQAIEHVAERFLGVVPAYLGWVPWDEAVVQAGKRREPFVIHYADGPAAGAVEALAAKLILAAQEKVNTESTTQRFRD
jgi:flagellar biosynthesis protein FlhG